MSLRATVVIPIVMKPGKKDVNFRWVLFLEVRLILSAATYSKPIQTLKIVLLLKIAPEVSLETKYKWKT